MGDSTCITYIQIERQTDQTERALQILRELRNQRKKCTVTLHFGGHGVSRIQITNDL